VQREWKTKRSIYLVILEYISTKNILEKVQETFGKSGCRYIIPGQYLAIDPKGRAVTIGTVYVYLIFDNFIYNVYYPSIKCHGIIISGF